jgi:hypothetical protein
MIRVTFVLFFGSVLLLPAQTPEQATTEAASQLAARIFSLLPRRTTVSLELQNLTTLPAADWSKFRTSLQSELRKSGIETAGLATPATQPDSHVRVTLSEQSGGLLFVAEVSAGDNRQIAMLPWKFRASPQTNPRVSIAKRVLWTQSDPILDLLLVDSDSQMLVLSTNGVSSFRTVGDRWMPSAIASFVLPKPLPRDPRGRLESTPEGFRAYLPSATCDGTFKPELRLTCLNGTAAWPDSQAHWVPDRNILQSDALKAPFYSNANGMFAVTDGRVQDRSGQPVVGSDGWGSDIAGIVDPCGGGTVVIASSANTDREEVRVYGVANGQATAASDPMPMPGPVTALWPSESRSQATLVVRNLQTGEYEASRLALACTE